MQMILGLNVTWVRQKSRLQPWPNLKKKWKRVAQAKLKNIQVIQAGVKSCPQTVEAAVKSRNIQVLQAEMKGLWKI